MTGLRACAKMPVLSRDELNKFTAHALMSKIQMKRCRHRVFNRHVIGNAQNTDGTVSDAR